jgi:hypothetical protein
MRSSFGQVAGIGQPAARRTETIRIDAHAYKTGRAAASSGCNSKYAL